MSGKRKSDCTSSQESATKKPNSGLWNLGLKSYLKNPDEAEYSDDRVVIIKDKYPKAKHHFLVLPKEEISSLKALNKEHITLLQHMRSKGQEIAEKCNLKVEFRYGYHAVPSMSHLHLHVISQDFDSPCLKTKKHWNSFTTEYFVDSDEVIKQLQRHQKFLEMSPSDSKALLNSPLMCHRCKKEFQTMPKLKQHIITHIPH